MKSNIKLIQIRSLLIFILIAFYAESYCQKNDRNTYFDVGFQYGYTQKWFRKPKSFGSVSFVYKGKYLDVGVLTGLKYNAYGEESDLGLDPNLPDNLLEGKEYPGWQTLQGNKQLEYLTNREMQIYANLYLGKEFHLWKNLSINLVAAPGIAYEDAIRVTSGFDALTTSLLGVDQKMVIYEVTYKRNLAYGMLYKIEPTWSFHNFKWAIGYEQTAYPKGISLKSVTTSIYIPICWTTN